MKTYAIDLSVLDGNPPVEQLKAWIPTPGGGEILVRFMSPQEHVAWVRGRSPGDAVTPDDWCAWRAHAEDWRGFVDAQGQPIQFTSERFAALWTLDAGIRDWFVGESRNFDNFRLGGASTA